MRGGARKNEARAEFLADVGRNARTPPLTEGVMQSVRRSRVTNRPRPLASFLRSSRKSSCLTFKAIQILMLKHPPIQNSRASALSESSGDFRSKCTSPQFGFPQFGENFPAEIFYGHPRGSITLKKLLWGFHEGGLVSRVALDAACFEGWQHWRHSSVEYYDESQLHYIVY